MKIIFGDHLRHRHRVLRHHQIGLPLHRYEE
jgi:hypothetical protein